MKKRKGIFSRQVVNRFKFINFILILINLCFFIDVFFTMKMIEQGRIVSGEEISYIIFQVNFLSLTLILMVTLTYIIHYGFGAVSRMERTLDEIAGGEYGKRIYLRKKDIMRPFAEKLNRILDILEESKKY